MALTTILAADVFHENYSHQQTTNFSGLSQGVVDVQFPLQMGVPVSPICVFTLVPTAGVDGNVANNFSFGDGAAGGSAPLIPYTPAQGTAPNISTIYFNYNGVDGILLDCERCLGFSTSTFTTQEFYIIVTGYDFRGVAIQYTTDVFPVNTGGLNLFSPPISFVTSVVFSANPFLGDASQVIEIQTLNIFGLPYALPSASYVLSSYWNGALLSASANSAIDYSYNWRSQASAEDTYLSARGRVNVGNTVPDGTKMLVVTYYVFGADNELSNEIENRNQSSLKIASVKKNQSSNYPTTASPLDVPVFIYPYLVPQDLTGVQTNPNVALVNSLGGDAAFLIHYNDLVAE